MLSGIIFVLPVIGVFGSVDRHETITWQCDVKDGDSFRMEWIEFMPGYEYILITKSVVSNLYNFQFQSNLIFEIVIWK